MSWDEWHKQYDNVPDLQERLRIVRKQIMAALDECPSGRIQIISICAGDGRDLIGALKNHPRRDEVTALLLDNNVESIMRGQAGAKQVDLEHQVRFLGADATLSKNYLGAVPADLVLLSGFLGHLRHENVPELIENLSMFCKTGAQVIWNRHLVLHDGREQVPKIRGLFRQSKFAEFFFETTSPTGFAVGRARFIGRPVPLDVSRKLFEFVGLDKLLSGSPEVSEVKTNFNVETKFDSTAKTEILDEAETSIPARFQEMAALYPSRMAMGGSTGEPTYTELDVATNRLANVLISHGGQAGDRVALLLRHDAPLIAASLAVLKAGRIVVVLNPTDPPARLKQILGDAEPDAIVTDTPNRPLAGQVAQKNHDVLCFEQHLSGPAHNPEIKIDPADLAWLIYTSGSTGRPKGVMQTHRNIVHNVLRLSREMDLKAKDRIILLGSPSGGQGAATTWCALLNGAALFPFPIAEKGVIGLKKSMLENRITVYVSSASVFRSFVKILDDTDLFPDGRLVRLGSEPATASDFTAFKKHFSERCVFLNSLSSSETGNITQYRLIQTESVAEGRLSVGRPVMGMEILLLDENGREVGPGEIGEIVVQSRYLSPGYWRNEKLTAERFSENGGKNGVRLFRSGDLGRRIAEGTLIFMDRQDARVKVHGYRVELSEIEETLARLPEVERAVVLVFDAPNGEIQLIAYVVPCAGRNCTAETLRHALRKTLPGYMVPLHFVFLDQIPLTPHGKVDHEKLRRINPSVPLPSAIEEPVTDTEVLLADIWKKIFARESIGRHDDFFDLGGDSLNAAVVAAQVYTALEVELELRIFADHSTLAKLSCEIDNLRRARGAKSLAGLVRAARDGPLPLSFAQERSWKHSQTPEVALGYTVVCSHRLCGPLDVEILRASMSYLVRRHEILRTTFEEVNGQVVQIVHPPQPVSPPLLDFVGMPDAEEKATRIFRQEARRPFDLKRLPLLRFMLARIRENEHWLLRVNHHIISDGWSWKIYFRELGLVYEAKLRGEAPPLPEFEPLQYGDYAAQQRRVLSSEGPAYRAMIEWWRNQFFGKLHPIKLPFGRIWQSRHIDPAAGVIWWGLNPTISRRLDQVGREEGATFYMIRLAAFVALLSAQSDRSDVILGTYMTERRRVEMQNMFGYFVNLATLRLQCDRTQTFREWLSVVSKLVGETQVRSEIPYEQLCEELRKQGVHPPEIRIIFNVTAQTAPVHFGGLELTLLDRHIENMPWGFCITFDQHDEERCCRAVFDARIYNPARVRNWLNQFIRLLEAISTDPDSSVGKLLAQSKLENYRSKFLIL